MHWLFVSTSAGSIGVSGRSCGCNHHVRWICTISPAFLQLVCIAGCVRTKGSNPTNFGVGGLPCHMAHAGSDGHKEPQSFQLDSSGNISHPSRLHRPLAALARNICSATFASFCPPANLYWSHQRAPFCRTLCPRFLGFVRRVGHFLGLCSTWLQALFPRFW